jgi:HD-like signal output (HDOD) protein
VRGAPAVDVVMSLKGKHPDPEMLRRFTSLKDLSDEQLNLLGASLCIQTAAKGAALLRRGSTHGYSLLLVAGVIELIAADGRRTMIRVGEPSARNPIAQLVPRRYDVIAMQPVAYLEMDSGLLEELRSPSQLLPDGSEVLVQDELELITPDSDLDLPEQDLLIDRIRNDLERDQLLLPSLPEIALRIGRALQDETSDIDRIARLIEGDPAIAAKVVRAANSALYGSRVRVESCAAAVARMGTTAAHKLVLGFALRELFKARFELLRRWMEGLWRHSTRVAAICYVLARLTKRFNAEHALLAGLIHDIGEVAILSYADRFPELSHCEDQIRHALHELRSEVGAMIMKRWQFSDELIVTAREAEHWERDPAPEADYCDLVIIAQLHSYVGTPRMQHLPHLGELPCFAKLDLGELSPRLSLKILERAEEQLRQAERLLTS